MFILKEQEKSDSLTRKLEGEQRAAKRIGQDITKYVQGMKQLEQEKLQLEEKLGKILLGNFLLCPPPNFTEI